MPLLTRPRPGAHRLADRDTTSIQAAQTDEPGPATADGTGLLYAASCLLLVLAAAQGYVSFRAQYTFINHAKHASLPSLLEALGLDTGAVIFALLALSLARRGRRGTVERVLNLACAMGSLTMNLLAANLGSPRSVTVWVLPSALYALASDRLIAVARQQVLTSQHARSAADRSAWRPAGTAALWALRLIFDPRGTMTGFRRWVLHAAPVPQALPARPTAHGEPRPSAMSWSRPLNSTRPCHNANSAPATLPAASLSPVQTPPAARDWLSQPSRAPGETKRHAMIRLYEQLGQAGDPRHGNRAKAAAMAAEIAAQIGYHPGTARRELARYLAAPPHGPAPGPEPVTAGDSRSRPEHDTRAVTR